MASHSLRILVIGLVPIALTACVETEAATPQPSWTVPAVGVDLGNSSRVPQIAGLAGEGEGYGRTEPGAIPTAHASMPGMAHEAGMQMDHGSMPGMSHGSTGGMQMDHGSISGMRHPQGRKMQMAHSGHAHAQGTGTVNSVDAAAHKVNVSHGPISAIGFPAMTMDFPVAPTVDLRTVKPGMRVNFTIEQGQGGMYEIRALAPAGGAR